MIKNQKAQGDVLLTPVGGEIPARAMKREGRTVAYGEATGHHHWLTAGDIYVMDDRMWVVVPEGGAELRHPEHGVIWLDPGTYQVDLQVEVDPFTGLVRHVTD